MSSYHQGEFLTHAFHVMPSMGPIVLFAKLQGRQNSFQITDQSTKPDNSTVYVQCTSVAINWANKMEQAQCNNSVGFPKYSHIAMTAQMTQLCYAIDVCNQFSLLPIEHASILESTVEEIFVAPADNHSTKSMDAPIYHQ